MSINFSTVSKSVHAINNPNLPLGTLIEEVPADIGRSYEGYKRGGVLEGAEKMRKEIMCALVWILGIPAFKKVGDAFCEKILNIPMDIDYSNPLKGNDTIKDSVEYLTGVGKNTTLDISGLKKYGKKFEGADAKKLIKNVRTAKKINAVSAVVLNCFMMGIVLPKINQKMTEKKMQKMQQQDSAFSYVSFDEFQNKTKQQNTDTPAFKGLKDGFVYNVENDNIFRLVVTDIPMIAGRAVTSRNKYEALEYIIMDGLSIYSYNFCANHVQKGLRKLTKTPKISPTIAELIKQIEPKQLEKIMNTDFKNYSGSLADLIADEKLLSKIYDQATYGKYGKINRFVKKSDLEDADKQLITFFDYIKSNATNNTPLFKDGKINADLINSSIKKTNNKNALFLALGLGISILGLAVIIPKFTFWVTKQLTGRNTFTGITNYDDDKKDVKKC